MSETDDFDWDGVSRPNAAPPHGLQGLEQKSMSGPYKVVLEENARANTGSRFVLTPVITVDGQELDLAPLTVNWTGSQDDFNAGGVKCTGKTVAGSGTGSFSRRTPRGLLMYDIDMTCHLSRRQSSVLIRNTK